ncbi:acyltransferase family protein [Novosphingobium lindaniclasticum]
MGNVRIASAPDGALLHPSREHHLDAVRAFLMLLGIPFHAAHPFRDDGQSWIVLSRDRSLPLTHLMEFLHLFRMQGFFLIAGYFTAMLLLKRQPAAYLQSRLVRLLPPLAAGLIVIVPLMNLAADLQTSSDAETAFAFWARQLLTMGRETTGHLWFVIVLIYFSCASAALALVPSARTYRLDRADSQGARFFTLTMIAIGLCVGVYEVALLKLGPFIPDLLQNPLSLGFSLEYAPYFALGALLNRAPEMNGKFNRFSWAVALIALCTALVAVGAPELPKYTRPVLKAVAAICLTQTIIAGARSLFHTESRKVRELVDASFVVYLLHLPIIIATFWLIDAMPVPYPLRYLALALAALVVSFAGWAVVKRSPWLLFFMSGVQIKSAKAIAEPAAQSLR